MRQIKRYYEHPNWREMETLSNKLISSNFNQIHLQVIEDIASLNNGHLSEYVYPSKFGFVTIEPFHCFDTILAFNGGGYNFHEMHWIPLFLNVFKNREMIKLYEVAK